MRLRILDLLVCPACGKDLSLHNARMFANSPPEQLEVCQGTLVCPHGHRYAIQDGVPRLLAPLQGPSDTVSSPSDDAQAISASFSREWGHFEYTDRTWMEAVDDRCTLFLKELNCTPEDLHGKVILDAGCGNASLSMGLMQRFHAEVLAADVSQSVVRAYQYFLPQDTGNTHFAQADLMNPPFRKSSFDIIYSSGVLHHNRNTRQALQAISSALKPGGRIYIWLYEKQPGLAHQLKQVFRSLLAPMPAPIKHAVISAWLPQSMLRQWLRYHLRGHRLQDRLKWRERMILLMDHYTPRYRWEHTPAEVHSWFQELGFQNIQTTEVRDWGFGVAATKPVQTPAPTSTLKFQSLTPA